MTLCVYTFVCCTLSFISLHFKCGMLVWNQRDKCSWALKIYDKWTATCWQQFIVLINQCNYDAIILKTTMDQGTWKREASYIPQQEHNGSPTTIMFSLQDAKGALARALKPFEVKEKRCGCVEGVVVIARYRIWVLTLPTSSHAHRRRTLVKSTTSLPNWTAGIRRQ